MHNTPLAGLYLSLSSAHLLGITVATVWPMISSVSLSGSVANGPSLVRLLYILAPVRQSMLGLHGFQAEQFTLLQISAAVRQISWWDQNRPPMLWRPLRARTAKMRGLSLTALQQI
jgi:hypothetical protein